MKILIASFCSLRHSRFYLNNKTHSLPLLHNTVALVLLFHQSTNQSKAFSEALIIIIIIIIIIITPYGSTAHT